MSNNGRHGQENPNTNNIPKTTAPNKIEKSSNGDVQETTAQSNNSNAFDEYDVKVSTSALLNVRTGAGMDFPIVKQLKPNNVITIVEESADKDSKKGWGRLKSGEGWVNLDFTEPVE